MRHFTPNMHFFNRCNWTWTVDRKSTILPFLDNAWRRVTWGWFDFSNWRLWLNRGSGCIWPETEHSDNGNKTYSNVGMTKGWIRTESRTGDPSWSFSLYLNLDPDLVLLYFRFNKIFKCGWAVYFLKF